MLLPRLFKKDSRVLQSVYCLAELSIELSLFACSQRFMNWRLWWYCAKKYKHTFSVNGPTQMAILNSGNPSSLFLF